MGFVAGWRSWLNIAISPKSPCETGLGDLGEIALLTTTTATLPREAKEKPPARSGCDGETWAFRPNGLCGHSFRSPGLVRRAHVGELREQIFVGPDLILRDLSI